MANLSNICRVCGVIDVPFISLFEDDAWNQQIVQKINIHLPITVHENDRYPTVVCHPCATSVLNWHQLVQTCKKTNRELAAKLNGCTQYVTERDNPQSDFVWNQSNKGLERCVRAHVRAHHAAHSSTTYTTRRSVLHRLNNKISDYASELLADHALCLILCRDCDMSISRKDYEMHIRQHTAKKIHYVDKMAKKFLTKKIVRHIVETCLYSYSPDAVRCRGTTSIEFSNDELPPHDDDDDNDENSNRGVVPFSYCNDISRKVQLILREGFEDYSMLLQHQQVFVPPAQTWDNSPHLPSQNQTYSHGDCAPSRQITPASSIKNRQILPSTQSRRNVPSPFNAPFPSPTTQNQFNASAPPEQRPRNAPTDTRLNATDSSRNSRYNAPAPSTVSRPNAPAPSTVSRPNAPAPSTVSRPNAPAPSTVSRPNVPAPSTENQLNAPAPSSRQGSNVPTPSTKICLNAPTFSVENRRNAPNPSKRLRFPPASTLESRRKPPVQAMPLAYRRTRKSKRIALV